MVWDWHEYTPGIDADGAYQAAIIQGGILANAIKLHTPPYKHVHFIGHSAGAKLIHEAASAYIYDYFIRQQNPFIHQTFLDAYTPSDADIKGPTSYGSLPTNYPNHYAEHYVDRSGSQVPWINSTNSCLSNTFNFDITGWVPDKDDRLGEFGHQWPRRWYQKSITFAPAGSTPPGFVYGYHLSRESGYDRLDRLSVDYPPGQQCPVFVEGARCIPARCW